ncbi:peptidoglycan/LPS O-acetylase OafA/YrhL [Mycobacterium sp. MAA66]|uniref:hypothetical protein n=1 Tax=Mycobacterium sp. MAA66 TaxID=3156297 RepID=UPI003518C116
MTTTTTSSFVLHVAEAHTTIYNSASKLIFFSIAIIALIICALTLWSKRGISRQRRIYWSSTTVVACSVFLASLPNWKQGLAVAAFACAILFGSAYFNTDYIHFKGQTYTYYSSASQKDETRSGTSDNKSPSGLTTATRFWTLMIGAALLLALMVGINLQPGGKPREALVAAVILGAFAAFFGHNDAINDHPIAGGQRVQFILISLVTVGIFPTIYLIAYSIGKKRPRGGKRSMGRQENPFR